MHQNLAADIRIELILFESKSNVLPLHQSAIVLNWLLQKESNFHLAIIGRLL